MKKKTKKAKSLKRESCTYVIEIKDWDFSYMFSVNNNKKVLDGPYWEHADLEMKGKLLHPEKLKDKEIDVTVMATRRDARIMNKPEDYEQCEPKAIGTLTIRGKYSELLCWVPFDAYQMLCSMLAAEKIKCLILHGEALYRGDAHIRSITFKGHYSPEDVG